MRSLTATLPIRFGDALLATLRLPPGERGDVRSADTLSVNPGLRPGQSNQRSMHRNAVPLRHKLVFCFLDKTGCASEKSKFQASLILLFLSACTNFAKNFYEEAEIGRGEKSLV